MGLDSLLFQSQKLVQTSGPKGGLRIVVASHVLSLDVHVRHRALTRHRQQFVLQGFTVGTSIQFVYGHVHARKLLSQQILCRSAVRTVGLAKDDNVVRLDFVLDESTGLLAHFGRELRKDGT